MLELISGLLVSLLFYNVPVLIYRFKIRKKSIAEIRKALGISFLFFVCSMIALISVIYISSAMNEIDTPEVSLGLIDGICFVLNCFIITYEKRSRFKKVKRNLIHNYDTTDELHTIIGTLTKEQRIDVLEYIKVYSVDFTNAATQNADKSPDPTDDLHAIIGTLTREQREQLLGYIHYLTSSNSAQPPSQAGATHQQKKQPTASDDNSNSRTELIWIVSISIAIVIILACLGVAE